MTEPGRDPRTDVPAERGVRPLVAVPRGGVPAWALAAVVAVIGVILFSALNARRVGREAPAVRPSVAERDAAPQAVPPLYIPAPLPTLVPAPVVAPSPSPTPTPAVIAIPRRASPPVYYPPPSPPITPPPIDYNPPTRASAAAPASGASALVIDTYAGDAPDAAATASAGGGVLGAPARASVLRRRATTIAQGTLIAAVLETAFDSTRPGLARALVTRDVRGFDGTRVLIPRGSRLIGEYRADLEAGQNRAQIAWTRLIRPDGATIAIGSPAADSLGRGGVKGSVDSHFLARFGGAILQSALNVGVNVASRAAGGASGVIVALPGGGSTTLPASNDVRPTLRVKQGTQITVFVARDLDFTGVERQR